MSEAAWRTLFFQHYCSGDLDTPSPASWKQALGRCFRSDQRVLLGSLDMKIVGSHKRLNWHTRGGPFSASTKRLRLGPTTDDRPSVMVDTETGKAVGQPFVHHGTVARRKQDGSIVYVGFGASRTSVFAASWPTEPSVKLKVKLSAACGTSHVDADAARDVVVTSAGQRWRLSTLEPLPDVEFPDADQPWQVRALHARSGLLLRTLHFPWSPAELLSLDTGRVLQRCDVQGVVQAVSDADACGDQMFAAVVRFEGAGSGQLRRFVDAWNLTQNRRLRSWDAGDIPPLAGHHPGRFAVSSRWVCVTGHQRRVCLLNIRTGAQRGFLLPDKVVDVDHFVDGDSVLVVCAPAPTPTPSIADNEVVLQLRRYTFPLVTAAAGRPGPAAAKAKAKAKAKASAKLGAKPRAPAAAPAAAAKKPAAAAGRFVTASSESKAQQPKRAAAPKGSAGAGAGALPKRGTAAGRGAGLPAAGRR